MKPVKSQIHLPQWQAGNWLVCGHWSSEPCDSDNAAAWCSSLSTGYGHTTQERDIFRWMQKKEQMLDVNGMFNALFTIKIKTQKRRKQLLYITVYLYTTSKLIT